MCVLALNGESGGSAGNNQVEAGKKPKPDENPESQFRHAHTNAD
jgi:hypothetical protein